MERHSTFARLALEGELDLLHVPAVEEYIRSIEEAGTEMTVVDLSRLSFIDSTGLRALLGAHNRAGDNGRRFVLVRGPRFVQKVFTVTGLEGVFEYVTEEDLAELRPGPDELESAPDVA